MRFFPKLGYLQSGLEKAKWPWTTDDLLSNLQFVGQKLIVLKINLGRVFCVSTIFPWPETVRCATWNTSGGEGLKALVISFNKSCIIVGCRALQGCHKGDRILGSFEALSFASQRNRHLGSLPSAKHVKCYIKQNLQTQVSSVRSLVSAHKGCYLALFLSPFLLSFFPSCLSSFLPGGFTKS